MFIQYVKIDPLIIVEHLLCQTSCYHLTHLMSILHFNSPNSIFLPLSVKWKSWKQVSSMSYTSPSSPHGLWVANPVYLAVKSASLLSSLLQWLGHHRAWWGLWGHDKPEPLGWCYRDTTFHQERGLVKPHWKSGVWVGLQSCHWQSAIITALKVRILSNVSLDVGH